jgi:purine-nucleoside phosphorylase
MLSINTIVVPQGAEYQAVCRGLAKAKVKERIQVIAIPLGVKQMSQVLVNYGEIISNSSNVLIMGLCGSLSNTYAVGDSVVVKSCVDLDHYFIDLDAELTAAIQRELSKSSIQIDLVAALTSDRIITQADAKEILAQQYPATIVEMEGSGYVAELQRQGIAVAMMRVVSDDLAGDIPDLNQAIDSQGNLQTLPLALSLIKQPLAGIRLIRGSLTGLKVLEAITAKLFYLADS